MCTVQDLLLLRIVNLEQSVLSNSWFANNLLEYGGQCQPPTPAGSDKGINNIVPLCCTSNKAAMTSNANHQYNT